MDMIVRLFDLPAARVVPDGAVLRRPVAYERRQVIRWVDQRFGELWAGETATALSAVPATMVIAAQDRTLLGFACYDVTARGFIGPIGVDEAARGRGLGLALTWAALDGLRQRGFAYAIIGDVGPTDFYARHFAAEPIAGSDARALPAVQVPG